MDRKRHKAVILSPEQHIENYIYWLRTGVAFDAPELDNLAYTLFNIDYTYTHPMDENREQDAFALRVSYFDDTLFVLEKPVSVLEVLVALAQRVDFLCWDYSKGSRAEVWFQMFIENLGLLECKNERQIIENCNVFMYRAYDDYGNGNVFTLEKPKKDFAKIEIWYQMAEWYTQNEDKI